MELKSFKYFSIIFIFAGFLFFVSLSASAQNSQLKIVSVKESVFLGTSLYVSGQAQPNSAISLSIKNEKDSFAYSISTNSDAAGNWSANFDQSLKSGDYYIEAISQDAGGMQNGQVRYGPVKIKGSFIFIVEIFSALVIILLAAFLTIWYMNKLAEIKRYRRILMSQRDAVSAYNVLKKDVDVALKDLLSEKDSEWKITEVSFLLRRTEENLEKMNKYVVKGINIISKYDIITKLESFLKFNIK